MWLVPSDFLGNVRWWWRYLHSSCQESWRRWYWIEHWLSRWRRWNGHHRAQSWPYQGNWRWRYFAYRRLLVLKCKLQEKLLRILVPVSPKFSFCLFHFPAGYL